ncbi:hypothetical protein EDD11_010582, partial [Mortierella claussenii]
MVMLRLFCIVKDESTAFSVNIPLTETVDGLKNAIKDRRPNTFSDVDAVQFSLWQVSIQYGASEEEKATVIAGLNEENKLDPLQLLQPLFPQGAAQGVIHIVVKPPQRGLLSEVDFLKYVPGTVVGQQQDHSHSTTSSRSPSSVSPLPRPWDILDSVRSMELDPTPQYQPPRFMSERIFRPETMLHDLFKQDMGSVRVLPPFADTTQITRLPYGTPDLVCLRNNGNPDLPESVLFPIEIKRPTFLRSTNLLEEYNAQERSGASAGPANALKQAFGYMRLNG